MRIVCAGIVYIAVFVTATFATAVAQQPGNVPEAPSRPRGAAARGEGSARPATTPQLERANSGRKLKIEIMLAESDGDIEEPTAAKILELQRAGKLTGVARLHLAALEELPTFVKFSEVVPRVVGHQSSGNRVTPIYNDINIGTSVQATLRMLESGEAIMQISVERSRLGKQNEGALATGEPRKVETLSAQSTTRTKLGESVLLSAGPLSAESTTKGWVIVTITEQ